MIRAFSFAVLLGLYAMVLFGLAFVPEDVSNVAIKQVADEVALAK